MKTTLFTLLLIAAFLVGCTDTPISPLDSQANPEGQLDKLVKLPPKSGLSTETVYSQTVLIDGEQGGEIKIKEYYWTNDGQKVKIDARLTIPKNAFTGSVNITMKIDDEYAAASFEPSMSFEKPLEFNLTINGLDLSQLNLAGASYNFVYVADDGNVEDVVNDGVVLDNFLKGLTVDKAQLNHFSRYAFSR